MIRKPDDGEFRERDAISALRDARTLAVEGGRGVGQGTASLLKWWFILMLGFGFVMSVLSHLGAAGMLVLMAGAVAWFILARQKRAGRRSSPAASLSTRMPRISEQADIPETGRYELSVPDVARRAATLAVPAVLLFPTAGTFSFMSPFTLFGIIVFALAILIVARLFGDRTVLRFDARALTVRGLLGEGTMLWDDVDELAVRKASIFNLPTLFTSGTRRNIEVTARTNRLGGPERLLIAYPLLGIDQNGLVDLFSTLSKVHAGAPDFRPSPEQARVPAAHPMERATDSAALPFDPDAIMEQYLAEREQLAANARASSVASGARPAFGRKVSSSR